MRPKILRSIVALLAMLAGSHAAVAQGTAFTYQGELSDGGNPVNGVYFLKAIVFDAAFNGNALTPAIPATVVAANGRFTITLDPGAGVLTGAPRWLEIYVRSNLSVPFTTLSPRQPITPAPYATFAAGANAAGLSGTIAAANIASGTITSSLLATDAVAANQIAAGAVTANKLGLDVGVWSVNGGAVYRSGGGVGIGVTNPSAALHLNGGMKLNGLNTIEFGAGVVGKELSAGKIGYQVFTADALDILGAGTTGANRQIKFWAEGGATFTGGANFSASIAAPSATIPTLSGNVAVSGNLASSGTISAPSATIPTLGGNVAVSGTLTSISGAKINGANTVEFGAGVAGKEPSAGKMGYEVFGPGALDIVGAGTAPANRQIRFWAEGGSQFMGTLNAPSANFPTLSATVATIPALSGDVAVNGILTSVGGTKINGANTVEFGAGVAGKEPSAGKLGYEILGPGALDIVGAGNTPANRQIRFWAEGNSQFMGPVSAPSANIPILSGNVTVNGEITAQVVTITGGSDVAEPYHVASTKDVEPIAGMVVSIDPNQVGQMRIACRAYDKTVAGILSGANGIAPGITLRQAGTIADGSLPVASIGRVWCYADADANGPIEAGDMLTTSETAGHAMKVSNVDRANGSVIGKAMSPLKSGRGLVLVFVSLK